MDKKNTMLLTVIAVATLLVAVVGATFAYFSVTTGTTDATTNVTATTKKIPTINLNQGKSDLNMELTATDMKQGDDTISYWASDTGKKTDKTDVDIATISSTGGESTDNYKCKLTVTVTSDNSADFTALGTGNVNLYLSGLTGTSLADKTIDLSDSASYLSPITTDITLTGEDAGKTLKAAFEIKNDHEKDQSSAANKTIKVKIATKISDCALQPAE